MTVTIGSLIFTTDKQTIVSGGNAMKKIIVLLSFAFLLAGCSNTPVAMKANKKYFAPVKTFAQKPAKNKAKFATSLSIEKELNEKNTIIDLLTKENEQLRARLAKLEKRLSIIQS